MLKTIKKEHEQLHSQSTDQLNNIKADLTKIYCNFALVSLDKILKTDLYKSYVQAKINNSIPIRGALKREWVAVYSNK